MDRKIDLLRRSNLILPLSRLARLEEEIRKQGRSVKILEKATPPVGARIGKVTVE